MKLKLTIGALLSLSLLLLGCRNAPAAEETPTAAASPTAFTVPPTFTPLPRSESLAPTRPVVTVTQQPLPTDTPISFGETVVELRYQVPALGLDRRLQGSVSSQIIVADETTGTAVQRSNQAGVLLDLQQTLPELQLDPLPEGCGVCVRVSYSLPLSEEEGDGWLQDRALLASIENFMTLSLGPHFPPGTVVGLRRSASPYAPAHSVAVTEDGRLFTWLANEAQVSEPTVADPAILPLVNALNLEELETQYTAPCVGTALESLYLNQNGETQTIGLVCPEYALPTSLQPLYLELDAPLNAMLAADETTLERPPAGFPLAAVVDYQRVDGARLTLYGDGTAVAVNAVAAVVSSTITSTQLISLTDNLLASGALQLGLRTFDQVENDAGTPVASPPRSLLLVRGSQGVYDAEWPNTANAPVLAGLNRLLNQLLGTETPAPENTGAPGPEETPGNGTPTLTPTPITAVTPTASLTPSATATP